MILSMLCRAVAGEDHQQYIHKMRRNGEWADTVFLHALGNVYGANMVVFQAGTDPALLGPCLHEDLGSTGTHLLVPVALVNDYHFWGVVPCVFFLEPEPIDKGELAPFMIGDGLSRPGKRQRTEASQPGLVRTRRPREAEDEEDGTHPRALYQNIGAQQNPVVSPE